MSKSTPAPKSTSTSSSPSPIPIKVKRRSLLVGPISCNGIRRVLASYKCAREEKRIVEAMFEYFEPTQEQKDLIGYRTLTEQEKLENGIPVNEDRVRWDNPEKVQEDIWSVELSSFEWATLRSAMSRFGEFTLFDKWERKIWEQIEDKPDEKKETEKKEAAPETSDPEVLCEPDPEVSDEKE